MVVEAQLLFFLFFATGGKKKKKPNTAYMQRLIPAVSDSTNADGIHLICMTTEINNLFTILPQNSTQRTSWPSQIFAFTATSHGQQYSVLNRDSSTKVTQSRMFLQFMINTKYFNIGYLQHTKY